MANRSYIGFLMEQDVDTLERWCDDALNEFDYIRDNGGSQEEIDEARQHVRDIRTAINELQKGV